MMLTTVSACYYVLLCSLVPRPLFPPSTWPGYEASYYGNSLERTMEDKLVWSRPNEMKPIFSRDVHTRSNTALTREQQRCLFVGVLLDAKL